MSSPVVAPGQGDTPLYQPLIPLELIPIPTLGPVEPDKMDRKDIDFTATWVPSGLSTVTGRLSVTREDHTAPSRGNFHGLTGGVTWDYKPTGKLSFSWPRSMDKVRVNVGDAQYDPLFAYGFGLGY